MSQTPCDADLPTRFGMGEDRDEQPGRIGEAQAVDFPSAAAASAPAGEGRSPILNGRAQGVGPGHSGGST